MIALGEFREKLQRDGIGIGDDIAGECLARAVWVIRNKRVVDREAVRREVAGALGSGGDSECVGAIELLLLRVFVVAKDKELIVEDRAADRAAFLVAMKVERRLVGCAVD